MRWMGLRLESDIKTSFFKVVLGGKEEWVSRGEEKNSIWTSFGE